MTITVSEDLNATPRATSRFCATVDADTDPDRAGFGRTEQSALWELARQLGIHPGTLAATATIERIATR